MRCSRTVFPRLTLTALLGVFAPLALLAGCAGTLTLPEQRPADYAMVLTVYPLGDDTPGRAGAFRPARYALEPDGLLRAEVGAGVTEPDYPPIARRLEPAQAETLYALARGLNLDQPDTGPANIPGPQVYTPPTDTPVAMIEVASLGTARAFELDAGPTAPAAPLLRELERLTWQGQD